MTKDSLNVTAHSDEVVVLDPAENAAHVADRFGIPLDDVENATA